MESLIGRNVICIIAAILVFIGLVFLGILVVPLLTDPIKIALMFLLSTLLTAGGLLLTARNKNSFTTTLLGCGCGSFFISILVAHAYFHAFNDIVAFSLLLVWMAVSLVLVKITDSLLMSILVHVGLVVSLCFAYFTGMGQDRIIPLLVYQLLAVAVVTVGNILCYRKAYRVGLLVSLVLSLVAVCVIYWYYAGALGSLDGIQRFAVPAVFGIHVLGGAVLSYLLFASMGSVQDEQARVLLHGANKLVFFGIVLMAILFVAWELFRPLFASAELPGGHAAAYALAVAAGLSLLFFVAHAALSIFLRKKTQSDTRLETASVVLAAAFASLLIVPAHLAALFSGVLPLAASGLILVAIALIVCNRVTSKPVYAAVALVVWAVDVFFMLFGGYEMLVSLGTVFAGLAYLALSTAVLIFLWASQDEAYRAQAFDTLKVVLILVSVFSILRIFDAALLSIVESFLVITLLFLIMLAVRLDIGPRATRGYWTFVRAFEVVLGFCTALVLSSKAVVAQVPVPAVLLAVASVVLLAWALFRVKLFKPEEHGWLACLQGICFTLVLLGAMAGLTDWLQEPYALSVVCMVAALICVAAGFVVRVKSLRLYGLVLTIVFVLKLLLIDTVYTESITRVVAFIGGGLICFGISALYTYAVKRLEK
jgi:hypothetical protein